MYSRATPELGMGDSTPNRRRLLAAIGAVGTVGLGGCSSGGESTSDRTPEERLSAFLAEGRSARGYEGLVDATGREELVIEVGAESGLAFAPAGVRISTGTTVSWQWTGRGGQHNVASVSESAFEFQSGNPQLTREPFEQSFSEQGVGLYVCRPHRGVGMKGGLIVE